MVSGTTTSGVQRWEALESYPWRWRWLDSYGSQQIPRNAQGLLRSLGGDHYRCPPSVPDVEGQEVVDTSRKCERLRDQIKIWQSLWLPRIPDRRYQAGNWCYDCWQGRRCCGFWWCRQGLCASTSKHGCASDCYRGWPNQCFTSRRLWLPSHHHGRRSAPRPNLCYDYRMPRYPYGSAFRSDEERCHCLQ